MINYVITLRDIDNGVLVTIANDGETTEWFKLNIDEACVFIKEQFQCT